LRAALETDKNCGMTAVMTRRNFAIALLGFAGLVRKARAEEDDQDDWQATLAQSIAQHDPLTLGRIIPPPDDESWTEVNYLLAKAPKPTASSPVTPFDVAFYLATTTPAKFRMAWPEPDFAHPTYANPLIVRLFLSTKTRPQGDETAWCAAFVNWCLNRAGLKGTASASSQSFVKESWGNVVWRHDSRSPPLMAQRGDIAVFRLRYDPGHGHVGFFNGISHSQPNSIEVLGGNQLRGHGAARRHLIGNDTFRIDGELALWAVLTNPGLRSV
jgi:uncharacterized protein (TIGR02594 family)